MARFRVVTLVEFQNPTLEMIKVSRSRNKIVEPKILPKKRTNAQCARMDLNKRFLPKPMTTTG